jgi:hypothetical protein
MTKMAPEQIYNSLGQLWASFPDLNERPLPQATKEWLGRAYAIVAASGEIFEAAELKTAMNQLFMSGDRILAYDKKIESILLRILYVAELRLPTNATGAFIPVGSAYDAVLALGKILSKAQKDVLIIDPYMDNKTLDQYAILAPEKVSIRLLADAKDVKADLKPTVTAWQKQYDQVRPLEARLAESKSLHDRIIFVDKTAAWTLTQSLNAFAARSPATILPSDHTTAQLKIAAYEAIWNQSKMI